MCNSTAFGTNCSFVMAVKDRNLQKLLKVGNLQFFLIRTVMNFDGFFLAKGTKQALYALDVT